MRNLTDAMYRMLIEPPSHIVDVSLRHKSRLINIFLLPMIIVFIGVDGIYLAMIPGYVPPWYGYVFLIGAYLLNRSRIYHRLTAFLILAMFPIVVLVKTITGKAVVPAQMLYYLIPGLILCGILLSIRSTVFFALIEIAVIFSLPFIVPNMFSRIDAVVGPASTLAMTAMLVLVSEWFRDKTEKDRQENLGRAEEKYRHIVENAIDGIYQSTSDGRFLNVNRSMARMYGYDSPEDMIQDIKNISSQLYVESDRRDTLRHLLEEENQVTGFESLDYRKDGSTIWTSTNIQAVRDENGKTLYFEGMIEDITNRKEAEQILRESEQRFRTLFNRVLDGIYRSSHDGRFLDVNPAMVRMFGYDSREEMLAVDIKKELYFSLEDRKSLLLDTGQKKVDEFCMRRKDGSEIWVEDHGHYVHDNSGNIIYREGILRDITERKQAESSLQNNQQRLQAFFNQSLDGFFFSMFDEPQKWDDSIDKEKTLLHVFANQRFTDVNNAMLEQYNITREKFLSLTSSDIFAHDPQQGLHLRRQLFDNGRLHTETYERREDGVPVWFEGEYVCLYDEQKRITGFFGIQRDITKRKQAELEREQLIHELAVKNAESETLRESFATIVGTFEFFEIIQHILDQIKRVIPYDSASVWKWEDNLQKFISGRNLPSMFQESKVEFAADEINAALPILKGEVPFILNNNVQEELSDFKSEPHTYINSWLAFPLKTHGKIIGLIALDGRKKNQFNKHHTELIVTFANQVAIALENSRLFSELQSELFTREKLIKELESKNTELERFTYTISHDLKSPLVTINGFLGYLKGDTVSGNQDRVMTDIQRIQDAVDKMHSLLKELLELSRIGRIMNPPEKILFGDLVQEALEIVHGQLEARKVTVQTQRNLPAIQGDRQRLVEVLQNLIDNAVKYIGDQPAPKIEIGQQGEEGDQLIFFVKDNGIGINPQYQERIFGLFNKLDAKSEGTGVGLALVKRIIEVHSGRIWVESEGLNKGSKFLFTLPRVGA